MCVYLSVCVFTNVHNVHSTPKLKKEQFKNNLKILFHKEDFYMYTICSYF